MIKVLDGHTVDVDRKLVRFAYFTLIIEEYDLYPLAQKSHL